MKVAVTGASGYLGGTLVQRLQGSDVMILAIAGPSGADLGPRVDTVWHKHVSVDTTTDVISAFQPDAVIHCANYYTLQRDQQSIEKMWLVNFELPTKIAEICVNQPLHFINLGSYFQYQGPGGTIPNSTYAETKQATSQHLSTLRKTGCLSLSDLVIYDVYGPNDPRNKLIPNVISSLRSGNSMLIRAPRSELNLVYLNDAVQAVILVLFEHLFGKFSVSSPINRTVREIVNALEKISGVTSNFEFNDDAPIATPDLNVAPLVPGWRSDVSLEEGLTTCWELRRT